MWIQYINQHIVALAATYDALCHIPLPTLLRITCSYFRKSVSYA